MIKFIKVFFLTILTAQISFGQNYSIDENTKKKIDSTYNALIKKYKVVGTSIAIVHNNEIVYANGYGFQDKENAIKADENTIYRIGSCTKSFSALGVLQLQENNKLSIHDPIQKHLKELSIKSRFTEDNAILIKDILNHTSGLPSDILNGFFCDTPPSIAWLIATLNNSTMAAPAGYQHAYSNTGYSLIGELIERVSGKNYETYITDEIFNRLNMNSSFIYDTSNIYTDQFSKGYLKGKAYDEVMIRDKAAGLIHSNVIDMGNYLKLFLARGQFNGQQIISASSFKRNGKKLGEKLNITNE